MADQRSGLSSGRRVFVGTTMGGLLGCLDKAEKKRNNSVITILSLMLELQSPTKPQTAFDIDNKKLLLDRELRKYRFVPDFSPNKAGRWTVEWNVAGSGRKDSIETMALELLLGYARAGKLNRFRKCGNCSRWMYAKFRHQVFCSTKCQQQLYGKSEKWKRYRRNYMREYRRTTM